MSSPYKILEVSEKADAKTIREAYLKKAFHFHPDRSNTTNDAFITVSTAYGILADPYDKSQYDLKNELLEWEEAKRIQYEGAQIQLPLMQQSYRLNFEMENAKQGLCIYSALYGVLPKSGYTINENCIDITTQLQCMVFNSTLVLPAGESLQELDGCYYPARHPGHALGIRILYLHGGQLHEVELTDRQPIRIPLREHCMFDSNAEKVRQEKLKSAPLQSKNYDIMQRRVLRQRLTCFSMGLIAFMLKSSPSV